MLDYDKPGRSTAEGIQKYCPGALMWMQNFRLAARISTMKRANGCVQTLPDQKEVPVKPTGKRPEALAMTVFGVWQASHLDIHPNAH